MHHRVILIILDGVGIGEMEDAGLYGDQGSCSLQNTAEAVGGLHLPQMQRMGLGNIAPIAGVEPVAAPIGAFGKMGEKSRGKDSTTGHWEMMGLVLEQPFPTYPHGFPADVSEAFEKASGRKTLGNVVASGTRIINDLGDEHVRTGYPIVYTSADSVFQIAAHEEVIPLEELYAMCEKARKLLIGPHEVGRVIARPFIGKNVQYTRTSNRHDFSRQPDRHVLDYLIDQGKIVIGVGKIKDLFAGRGISESIPARNNQEAVKEIIQAVREEKGDLIFANMLDFDQTYGHRNDVEGYAEALESFDCSLKLIIEAMFADDLLIITADHGNDPTTASTDHSREYVPLLVYGKKVQGNVNLGVRSTFADVGQTTASYLQVPVEGLAGESFLPLIVQPVKKY